MTCVEAETFGVYTDVTTTKSDDGYPSVTLYTARGDSLYGTSLSAYWSLTVDEAERLGADLIAQAKRAREQGQIGRRVTILELTVILESTVRETLLKRVRCPVGTVISVQADGSLQVRWDDEPGTSVHPAADLLPAEEAV